MCDFLISMKSHQMCQLVFANKNGGKWSWKIRCDERKSLWRETNVNCLMFCCYFCFFFFLSFAVNFFPLWLCCCCLCTSFWETRAGNSVHMCLFSLRMANESISSLDRCWLLSSSSWMLWALIYWPLEKLDLAVTQVHTGFKVQLLRMQEQLFYTNVSF